MTLPPTNQVSAKQSWFDIIRFALITLIIVIPIRTYIAQPFIVNGASMEPSFDSGEYLIIDELSYHFSTPKRGEVVVFRYPKDPSKFFIKRVIGLPGEHISITNQGVTITKGSEQFTLDEPYIKQKTLLPEINIQLTETEYFVMGDNRDVSSDSRVWGPLDEDLVTGRVWLRLIPLTKIGIWPGSQVEQTKN